MDQVAVLADPAQARFFRPGLIEQGRAIDAGAPPQARHLLLQPAAQLAQPAIDHPVVVPTPAIARHLQAAGLAFGRHVVIEPHGQQAAGAGKQAFGGPAPGVGHPGHLGLVTGSQPAF